MIKKLLPFICLILPLYGDFDSVFDSLVQKLIEVESNGNLDAIGDAGKAYGQLQIHEVAIKDVNRLYGTSYKHEDAFDYYLSIEICYLYLKFWSSARGTTEPEHLARIWNGGPLGHRKDSTLVYWEKIQKKWEM